MKRVAVLKLGGELIETKDRLKALGKAVVSAAKKNRLIVVHGGGREIDAALAQVGIPKRQVDGLRVTDEDTLNIVVSVLAGSINTRFVAAINAAGGKAIGLTGADAGVAPAITSRRAFNRAARLPANVSALTLNNLPSCDALTQAITGT